MVVCDEEDCTGSVPDEALHFVFVLNLFDNAPHVRIVKIELFQEVAGSEEVLGAHGLPRTENPSDDLLFRPLNVHGLSWFAQVPDPERTVLRG